LNLRMTKFLIVFIIALVSWDTKAQDQGKTEILQEINNNIWKPFSKAYINWDSEAYLSLHSPDLIRAGHTKVSNLNQYSENVTDFFQLTKEQGAQLDIQFRFSERICDQLTASERGVYQLTVINFVGESSKYYGKFHVFLRKESNIWKILIDYDSSENNTINENNFQEAFDMEDFEKY
jgi:hypothetical protein